MTLRDVRLVASCLAIGYVIGYVVARVQADQELTAELTHLWHRSDAAKR